MRIGAKLALYGLLLFVEFSLVFVATAMNSAIPLFFAFLPAVVIMWIERTKATQ